MTNEEKKLIFWTLKYLMNQIETHGKLGKELDSEIVKKLSEYM